MLNGIANNAKAPIKLIAVSDKFSCGKNLFMIVLVIHKKTVIAKIVSTLFSCFDIGPSFFISSDIKFADDEK
jgi:hypothetical protein